MFDTPSEVEMNAYVDGELDNERRFAVESRLARHPHLAARVLNDLSQKTALRLLSGSPVTTPGLAARADSLKRSIWPRGGVRAALPLIAGTAALTALLILPLLPLLPAAPPSYINDAVASHRVAMTRATMDSQIETTKLDLREIMHRTRIAIPVLPEHWRITDVQVFPANGRAAVLVAVKTAEGQALSIFAIRERSTAPERPDAVREGAQSVAYWRRGEMSFALTGEADPSRIDAEAEDLSRFWS